MRLFVVYIYYGHKYVWNFYVCCDLKQNEQISAPKYHHHHHHHSAHPCEECDKTECIFLPFVFVVPFITLPSKSLVHFYVAMSMWENQILSNSVRQNRNKKKIEFMPHFVSFNHYESTSDLFIPFFFETLLFSQLTCWEYFSQEFYSKLKSICFYHEKIAFHCKYRMSYFNRRILRRIKKNISVSTMIVSAIMKFKIK